MESQITGRVSADVEVLVEPAVRRDEDARLVPRDDHLVLPLRPHDGVALTSRNDDHNAGPMAMALFVRARREYRHVAPERRLSELDADAMAARSALGIRVEL